MGSIDNGSPNIYQYLFHVDFTTPSNSTFTGVGRTKPVPGVASFRLACGGFGACIPQPGVTDRLDSLGDRLMYRLIPSQLIQNGGFENGNLTNWSAGGVYLPFVVTGHAHSGKYSAQLGASSGSEPNGNSSLYQTITIPSTVTSATLTFWYWASTTTTTQYDWQEAQVQNSSGTVLAQIMKIGSNTHAWTQRIFNLTPYKGQTIRIYFNDHQDGRKGNLTYMYLDDVSVVAK